MRIETYALPSQMIDKELKDRTCIVIDVLRASSSIITALENGCREVAPTGEVDEAVSLARSLGHGNVLLCGERGAELIPGFQLSNSPMDYTRENVENRILVMSTTNGTRAVLRAKEAGTALLGAFLNATAVAEAALALGNDITLLCAGTFERFSTDDVLAAGAIIDRLTGNRPDAQLDDLSRVAGFLYRSYRAGEPLLDGVAHVERLRSLGYEADIAFCLQEDAMKAVPIFKEGVLRCYAPANG